MDGGGDGKPSFENWDTDGMDVGGDGKPLFENWDTDGLDEFKIDVHLRAFEILN